MMRRALLLLLPLAACAAEGRNPGTRLSLAPCQLGAPGAPGRVAAKCGTLAVREDRSKEGGRSIELRIAVVPAVSRTAIATNPERMRLFISASHPTVTIQSFQPYRHCMQDSRVITPDRAGSGHAGCHSARSPLGPS